MSHINYYCHTKIIIITTHIKFEYHIEILQRISCGYNGNFLVCPRTLIYLLVFMHDWTIIWYAANHQWSLILPWNCCVKEYFLSLVKKFFNEHGETIYCSKWKLSNSSPNHTNLLCTWFSQLSNNLLRHKPSVKHPKSAHENTFLCKDHNIFFMKLWRIIC